MDCDNPFGIIVNYEKTWVYKIECKDPTVKHTYVGHTTSSLSAIKSRIKKQLNQKKCGFLYIRENGGWDNWVLTKVEDFPCSNGEKAYLRTKQLYCEINNARH